MHTHNFNVELSNSHNFKKPLKYFLPLNYLNVGKRDGEFDGFREKYNACKPNYHIQMVLSFFFSFTLHYFKHI